MTPTSGDLARRALEMAGSCGWVPVADVPEEWKDGRVVWGQGRNTGDPKGTRYFVEAVWQDTFWCDEDTGSEEYLYLTHLRLPPDPQMLRDMAAENTALREALDSLLPGPLCGEAWGLPDTEKVAITVTFGAIRFARALSPTSPNGGDDA